MSMRSYPLGDVCKSIEPGPAVLVTTMHRGRANVMTMAWHTMLAFEPPLIGCVIGPWDHSFKALQATKECVIAIPTVDIIKTVVDIGNCSGEEVEKFATFGLTAIPGKKVKPPLVAECLANVECKVVDTRFVKKYGFHVLEAVYAWHDPKRKEKRMIHHNGDGGFVVDGRRIDLKKRMVKFQ